MPPMMAGTSATSALDTNAQPTAQDPQGDSQSQIAAVRQASDPFMQFLSSRPALQPLQKKFMELVKQAVLAVSQQSSQQTASSQQLPG